MAENQSNKGNWKKKKWIIKTKKKPIEIPVKDVVEIGIFVVVLFTLTFGTFWILQAALQTKTPMVVVSSGSMTGTYNEGDLLFIRGNVDPAEIVAGDHDLKTGDVIVFEADWSITGDPIVHRVVDKRFNFTGDESWEFQTQGDNDITNPNPDSQWAHEDDIVGIVVGRIPWIGNVKLFLSNYGLTIPLIIILVLVLMISIAWDLTHPEKEEEEKKKPKRRLFRRKDEPPEKEEDTNAPVNLGV